MLCDCVGKPESNIYCQLEGGKATYKWQWDAERDAAPMEEGGGKEGEGEEEEVEEGEDN